ncbi:hypothetical protein BpHYR1_043857 [Brachionus plicatilis]|uniref:Transmembrane protein n=1 Tax=Brachionus plicatilis TaxID=10195 RepID=A0A3M7TC37_BRAPC|nr:hypothetical protein BpHYR1_043857 [Brachionus plicatilis]
MITLAPSRAQRRAIALPMPRDAPVMNIAYLIIFFKDNYFFQALCILNLTKIIKFKKFKTLRSTNNKLFKKLSLNFLHSDIRYIQSFSTTNDCFLCLKDYNSLYLFKFRSINIKSIFNIPYFILINIRTDLFLFCFISFVLITYVNIGFGLNSCK